MSIYIRRKPDGTLASPYWWKKYDIDPATGQPPRPPASTKIHVDGGSKKQSAQNEADAKLQFQADCIAIRNGTLPAKKVKPRMLLREYAPVWFRKHGVKHATSEKTESMMKGLLLGMVPGPDGTLATGKALGDYFLHELTGDVVDGWRLGRTHHYAQQPHVTRRLKPTSANRGVALLRTMLTAADEYLDAHPLKGETAMGGKKLAPLSKGDTETRYFSREEFARFIAALESRDEIAGIPQHEGIALAYTAVETLLRRGSLMRLTWSLYRETYIVPLDAKVSIPRAPVTENMRFYLDQLPRDTPDDLVFPSMFRTAEPSDSEYMRDGKACSVLNYWFKLTCELAGLPCGRKAHGLTFHSFRHTGATWLVKAGKNPRAVMDLGGWKNANVFLSIYCHSDDAEVDAAAGSLFAEQAKRRNLRLVKQAKANG